MIAILVGDDAASKIYVRNKEKYAAVAGIKTDVIRMPFDTDTKTLVEKIHELNADKIVAFGTKMRKELGIKGVL